MIQTAAVRALALALYATLFPLLLVFWPICFPHRIRIMHRNIAQHLPPRSAAARWWLCLRCQWHWTRFLIEVLLAFFMKAEDFRRLVVLENPEVLRRCLCDGRSIMALTSHQGNWEWVLLRMGLEFCDEFHLQAIYTKLHDNLSEKLILKLRSRFGQHMVEKKTALQKLRHRRREATLTLSAADQVPSRRSAKLWCRFFGVETAFASGVTRVASALNAESFFMVIRRIPNGRYSVRFEPLGETGERDVQKLLLAYVAQMEKNILAQPETYFWLNNRERRYTRQPDEELIGE